MNGPEGQGQRGEQLGNDYFSNSAGWNQPRNQQGGSPSPNNHPPSNHPSGMQSQGGSAANGAGGGTAWNTAQAPQGSQGNGSQMYGNQGRGASPYRSGFGNPGANQAQSPAQGFYNQGMSAGETDNGVTLIGEQRPPKEKKKVGLGTAMALMLAGAVAVGSITGIALGGSNKNDTSTVNEVLKNAPVANSTGEEPAKGSVEAVAAKVLPAVVSIEAYGQSGAAEGSGSIISPDGYVLTNHHVVAGAENGGQLRVTMNDGSKHAAEVVASDANTDVAIVKIADVSGLPYLEFGDSDAVAVGQEVVAVGSPLGLNATVTSGIVSAKNRPVRASQGGGESSLVDAIQTDAAVNPGNSGGPLVDINGNLVGMNSMIASLSNSGSSEAGSIGLGFAIPSNFAKRMAEQLINNGSVKHPALGVKVDARDSGNGARIVEVEPDSPAEKAGLKAGDLVTRVNDRLIDNSDSLIAAARSQDFGAKVTLEVSGEDGKDPRQVEVTLSGE
ncbi:trypsin-like peptidase domain-containing protein [Corynebacterium striatum]|uniref:S1C family serine protease n=1 Tax=Corynebacterium striatum TaxID=43770 RepID=UPI00254A7D5D|nr:trypsin-like peptidase domain-containing protein [Corynebacterium striatum]MDK8788947.1 trypsin-like peptidase domain-containing protein [Corynebacterium striatum]